MEDFTAMTTEPLTESKVRVWARQAISGWFTGDDDGFEEQLFGQYLVSHLKDGSYWFTDTLTGVGRRFEIAVVVVEVAP